MEAKLAQDTVGLDSRMVTIDLFQPNCNPNMDILELFQAAVVEKELLVVPEVSAVPHSVLHILMEKHFQYTIGKPYSFVHKHRQDHAC